MFVSICRIRVLKNAFHKPIENKLKIDYHRSEIKLFHNNNDNDDDRKRIGDHGDDCVLIISHSRNKENVILAFCVTTMKKWTKWKVYYYYYYESHRIVLLLLLLLYLFLIYFSIHSIQFFLFILKNSKEFFHSFLPFFICLVNAEKKDFIRNSK